MVKSPVCEIPAEILAFPGLVECQSARSIEIFGVRWLAPTPRTPSEIVFPLPNEPGLPDRLDYSVRACIG
jgi:hypothetical protein